jgi:hypothetical protein
MSMQARDDGSTQNLSVVQRVGAALRSGTIVDAADAFEPEVIWHYFNAKLPDLAGDYVGVSGIEHFFTQLAARTKGTLP